MDFNNLTSFACQYWSVLDKKGQQQGVLTVKALFNFAKTDDGWHLKLKPQQSPLIAEEAFFGEMNLSAVRHESEFIPPKPVTDVILNATAYAPDGINTVWRAGIQIGDNTPVIIDVTGKRVWQQSRFGLTASKPEESESVPVRYENAFGGILLRDDAKNESLSPENVLLESTYNPIGCGLTHESKNCDGLACPQILWPGQPLKAYDPQLLMPAGFGHIGRGWQPRIAHAGTYDETWLAKRHPLSPMDFSSQFYNAANPRLQMKNYLNGDEVVSLFNLDPHCEQQSFNLPGYRLMWRMTLQNGSTVTGRLVLDSLLLDIEQGLWDGEASLCWRTYWPFGDEVKALTVIALPPKDRPYQGGLYG